ncbi:MAG: tRNA (adenosine(37)-N6)-threonylcarbamoyltransferase complex ATPase subunit type 1 TsaE [Bacillota bacterium]|nr:tRNA (adenosine(37)-N6)-threonylcarbamoyltransferase complex ATPase subunit type 1 TsaE [Bacillota bacterium]
MQTIMSNSPADTEKAGYELAKTLHGGQTVALFGDLGAGKTAFVRGFAKAVAPEASVTSPTFTVMQYYPGNPDLYHFDMYRIDSFEDLYNTGFFDYLEGDGICIIEWSEKIDYVLPDEYVKVTIEKTKNERQRLITVKEEKK